MKKALAGVLAVALAGAIAVSANAQVPTVTVYFDQYFSHSSTNCGLESSLQDLYVVAEHFNTWVLGVDFSIAYPPELFWLQDNLPSPFPTMQKIGNSPTGVGVSWNLPQSGWGPVLALIPSVLWLHCECGTVPSPMVVSGYTPLNKPAPTAVQWPNYAEIPGVGMTSYICPGVIATDNKTWGGIKALYR
jgi:hypothetical protein